MQPILCVLRRFTWGREELYLALLAIKTEERQQRM